MDDLLERGVAAFKAGNPEEARKLFLLDLEQNKEDERLWGWMCNVARNDRERIYCLKQVVRINPKNFRAFRLLTQITISHDLSEHPDMQITRPVDADQYNLNKQASKTAQTKPASPAAQRGGDLKVFSLQCVQDVLDVYIDKLKITPQGMAALFNKGRKGARTIPFEFITAVQFKRSASFTNGYIQFILSEELGKPGDKFDAARDENTVLFGAKDEKAMEEIKDYIEKQIQLLRDPSTPNQSPASIASEIEKLVALKNKGVLTEEEFQAAKKRIIGWGVLESKQNPYHK